MTLQQLRYVIAVADHGSMNEAAKALFISQPSLSGAVKELEKELGFELFLRTSRGIVVTPDGEEFLGYARQVTEQYRLQMCIRDRCFSSLLPDKKNCFFPGQKPDTDTALNPSSKVFPARLTDARSADIHRYHRKIIR